MQNPLVRYAVEAGWSYLSPEDAGAGEAAAAMRMAVRDADMTAAAIQSGNMARSKNICSVSIMHQTGAAGSDKVSFWADATEIA